MFSMPTPIRIREKHVTFCLVKHTFPEDIALYGESSLGDFFRPIHKKVVALAKTPLFITMLEFCYTITIRNMASKEIFR